MPVHLSDSHPTSHARAHLQHSVVQIPYDEAELSERITRIIVGMVRWRKYHNAVRERSNLHQTWPKEGLLDARPRCCSEYGDAAELAQQRDISCTAFDKLPKSQDIQERDVAILILARVEYVNVVRCI